MSTTASSSSSIQAALEPLIGSQRSSAGNPSTDASLNPARTTPLTILAACYDAEKGAGSGVEGAASTAVLDSKQHVYGIRALLQGQGHILHATSDIEGSGCEFDRLLSDADIVITNPFYPVHLNASRLANAKRLRLVITGGVGSDHIDLDYCSKHGITVTEITDSNAVGVAEHTIMTILALIKQFPQAQHQARQGEWNLASINSRSYDLKGKHIGIVGSGTIGREVMRRLKSFDVQLHYWNRSRMNRIEEMRLGATYHADLKDMLRAVNIVSIHTACIPATVNLFTYEVLKCMPRGSFLINTARGKVVNRDDLVRVMKEGHLGGYGGDTWEPEPAPREHPWRRLPLHLQAMTPHVSGDTKEAQQRIAKGVQAIVQAWIDHKPIPKSFIVINPLDAQQTQKMKPAAVAEEHKKGTQVEEYKQPISRQAVAHPAIKRVLKEGKKLITVFGATGQQGGSVVRSLHATNEWSIRGVTRDPSSSKARQLCAECPGIELAQADMLDKAAVCLAVEGASVVFCVTDFYTSRNLEKIQHGEWGELEEGCMVADCCLDAGVEYFICSSLPNVEEETSGRWIVAHFTAKHRVEEHARDIGLRTIAVNPGVFMQNFSSKLFPTMQAKADGTVEWRLPLRHDVALPLIDIDQLGVYVREILRNPYEWVGKYVLCAAEYLTLDHCAAIYSHVTGQPTYYKRQTMDEYRQENAKLPFLEEYVEQFSYFNEFGYYGGDSLGPTLKSFPRTRTFREWLIHSGWKLESSTLGKMATSMGLAPKVEERKEFTMMQQAPSSSGGGKNEKDDKTMTLDPNQRFEFEQRQPI